MFVKVKITPGSRKEEVKKNKENSFSVLVREKAERNLANKRVCEIMAQQFNVPVNKVRIINGHQSRSKILSINLPD